jgi:hypothetical protein
MSSSVQQFSITIKSPSGTDISNKIPPQAADMSKFGDNTIVSDQMYTEDSFADILTIPEDLNLSSNFLERGEHFRVNTALFTIAQTAAGQTAFTRTHYIGQLNTEYHNIVENIEMTHRVAAVANNNWDDYSITGLNIRKAQPLAISEFGEYIKNSLVDAKQVTSSMNAHWPTIHVDSVKPISTQLLSNIARPDLELFYLKGWLLFFLRTQEDHVAAAFPGRAGIMGGQALADIDTSVQGSLAAMQANLNGNATIFDGRGMDQVHRSILHDICNTWPIYNVPIAVHSRNYHISAPRIPVGVWFDANPAGLALADFSAVQLKVFLTATATQRFETFTCLNAFYKASYISAGVTQISSPAVLNGRGEVRRTFDVLGQVGTNVQTPCPGNQYSIFTAKPFGQASIHDIEFAAEYSRLCSFTPDRLHTVGILSALMFGTCHSTVLNHYNLRARDVGRFLSHNANARLSCCLENEVFYQCPAPNPLVGSTATTSFLLARSVCKEVFGLLIATDTLINSSYSGYRNAQFAVDTNWMYGPANPIKVFYPIEPSMFIAATSKVPPHWGVAISPLTFDFTKEVVSSSVANRSYWRATKGDASLTRRFSDEDSCHILAPYQILALGIINHQRNAGGNINFHLQQVTVCENPHLPPLQGNGVVLDGWVAGQRRFSAGSLLTYSWTLHAVTEFAVRKDVLDAANAGFWPALFYRPGPVQCNAVGILKEPISSTAPPNTRAGFGAAKFRRAAPTSDSSAKRLKDGSIISDVMTDPANLSALGIPLVSTLPRLCHFPDFKSCPVGCSNHKLTKPETFISFRQALVRTIPLSRNKNGPQLDAGYFSILSSLQPQDITIKDNAHFLLYIEQLYLKRYINKESYSNIFDQFSSLYISGDGGTSMYLWDIVKHSMLTTPDTTPFKAPPIDNKSASHVTLISCTRGCSHTHAQIRGTAAHRRFFKCLNKLYPYPNANDKSHTLLDLTSLVAAYINTHNSAPIDKTVKERVKLVNQVLKLFKVGTHNSIVTGWLVAAIGSEDFLPYMSNLVRGSAFCSMRSTDLCKWLKTVSVAIRRTAKFIDGSPLTAQSTSMLAYTELFVGRGGNKSNWQEERQHRCHNFDAPTMGGGAADISTADGLLRHTEFLAALKIELEDSFRQLFSGCKPPPAFDKFVAMRQQWLASGSSAGYKARLPSSMKKRPLGKRATFETLTDAEILQWMLEDPYTFAVASEKYEMGKARAIYGVDIVNYFICSYVLCEIERNMYKMDGMELGLKGIDEMLSVYHRCEVTKDPKSECTMLDYADFNIHHTLLAQQLIFHTLAKLAKEAGYPEAYVNACLWIGDGFLDSKVQFPDMEGLMTVVRGMFSGHRATNFINSIMNKCYYQVAAKLVISKYNIRPTALERVHQGDDVWLLNFSRVWALLLFHQLIDMGFVMQISKQMFGIGRGEFLRVLYQNGEAVGYLNRAISSLLIKPLQSNERIDPMARVSGIVNQIYTIVRRGYNTRSALVVYEAMVPYWSKIYLPDLNKTFSIPLQFIMACKLDGGCGLIPPGCSLVNLKCTLPTTPLCEVSSHELETQLPHNMVDAWIRTLPDVQTINPTNISKLVRNLHRANIMDSVNFAEQSNAYEILYNKWEQLDKRNPALGLASHAYAISVYRTFTSHESLESLVRRIGRPVISQPIPSSVARAEAERWDMYMAVGGKVKINHFDVSVQQQIATAISATPFKSLSNATTWYNIPLSDVITKIVGHASSSRDNSTLSVIHSALSRSTSEGATQHLLGGGGLICPHLQQFVHPTVYSVINNMLLSAITKCISLDDYCSLNTNDILRQQTQLLIDFVSCIQNKKTISTVSRY